MLHQLALIVLLAVAAQATPKQQYRLVNLKVDCGEPGRCPEPSPTGKLPGIQYGEKNSNLFGDFEVVYKSSGEVDFKVTARGTTQNPVHKSIVVLGTGNFNEIPDECKRVTTDAVVSFSNINFNDCAFAQTFNGNYVNRSITVRVRHQFRTGEVSSPVGSPVLFIGYRDIRVDFFLEPKNPVNVIPTTQPPPPPPPSYNLDVCVKLDHTLDVLESPLEYFWHVRVRANDNTTNLFGLGFKLESCWAVPHLRSGGRGGPAYFLLNGKLDRGVLFDPNSNPPVVDRVDVSEGRSYEFSFHQLTLNSVNETELVANKTHEIHCTVCLCNLSGADNRCPTTIDVDWIFGAPAPGRSALRPYRLLTAETTEVAPGMARRV